LDLRPTWYTAFLVGFSWESVVEKFYEG
jgi:hypothetical protein